MRKNFRFPLTVCLAAASMMFIFCRCRSAQTVPAEPFDLRLYAEEFRLYNERLPMQIDSLTIMDSFTIAADHIFQSHMTILFRTQADVDGFERYRTFGPAYMAHKIRYDTQLADLRRYGITFRYTYRNSQGEQLLEFDVTPEMYR